MVFLWEACAAMTIAESTHAPTAAVSDASRHWVMLGLALGIILAAAMLEVLPGERVAVRGVSNFPLPQLCMSRAIFNLPCPGCGLTRSFIHLAHGQWQAAWHVHRLGWLLAALVVVQMPYRALVITGQVRPLGAAAAQCLAFVVVGLLVVNWGLIYVFGG
ncbi:MAG TPA: DUF2752 domain-containing protein [Pirellulales bacterium]|nr:DUF2752 domain-containing protein [Pirellulales bacterium]